MDLQKLPGEEKIASKDEGNSTGVENSTLSRRKFTRNALLGSAVLLTLSNKAAWAEAPSLLCVSTNSLVSYTTGQASQMPMEKIDELENFIKIRDNYGTYQDKGRSYRISEDVTDDGTNTCFEYHPK